MKKSGFNEAQIIAILKEPEAGKKVADLARSRRRDQSQRRGAIPPSAFSPLVFNFRRVSGQRFRDY
jgi:hypothetical protein